MAEFKSFYHAVDGNEGSLCVHNIRLDTYGCGCSHDCSYCYAKSLLDFRGLWHPDNPESADIGKVRKKVKRIPPDKVIRLGGMTDCFQPVEKTRRVTYETIKALNESRVPYLIVTKSAMVADPEYIEILDKDLAHIQVTVTILDDEKYKELSYEKASLPSERIRAIKALQSDGFDVAMRLSPFIPELIGYDIDIGVEKIILEFLRVNHWIMKWFPMVDYSAYTLKHGGYRHLQLEDKISMLERLNAPITSVCEDVPEHYQYWQNKFHPGIKDCCMLR